MIINIKKFNIFSKKYLLVFGVVALIFLSAYLFLVNSAQKNYKCGSLSDDSEKIVCWKEMVDADLAKGDLDKSMDLVADFYQNDSVFASNCHDFTHTVGKKAYEMFKKGIEFKVGDKTSYCAYGFYHGFMESLVSENGDIEMARDFCKQVDAELSKISSAAKLACYHGIGHGWTNVHDKKLWGNEKAMVEPAIALCEKVTSDPEELKICVTGVFDSISIGYYNLAYDLKIKKNDPYWLCKEQKEIYKTPCYMDLSPAVVWLGEYKLDKSLKYISTVEPDFRDLVVKTLAEDIVRFIIRDNRNIEEQIKICRTLDAKQAGICIQGIASGYLQFGPPKEEEKLSLEFCSNNFLTNSEKSLCYSRVAESIKWVFSNEKFKSVCGLIPNDYQNVCNF